MNTLIIFSLVVGIGSTLVLDLWGMLLFKLKGTTPTDWGSVGRWLLGLRQGAWVAIQQDTRPPSAVEKISGWTFHYLVGVAYAVILVIGWGMPFIQAPTLLPIILVGIVLSSIAGLMLFMPAMGAGFCGRKIPNRGAAIIMMIIAHTVFALGQYSFTLLYANA
ncbi:Protein of unknown function [Rosenbergiella nectarea]|uniref:DUF2938 domain-containing protein n=1 Tax=Rosenbergiella nectarea TaxID=988801 RepID=A0A1H9J4G5_9GAMM|nr:DUF2938 family protein [Rosenbergiella nectarea]SEQ81713.1 Protein of unknown function [Rosenbergiella nectarea]